MIEDDREAAEKRLEDEKKFLDSTIDGYIELYIDHENRVIAVMDGIFTDDQLRDAVSAMARIRGDA